MFYSQMPMTYDSNALETVFHDLPTTFREATGSKDGKSAFGIS